MSKLADNLKTATGSARDTIAQAGTTAKRKVAVAAEKGKLAATRSVESSKELAKKAGKVSNEGIEKNPLAIVAGGIAIGAIIGMLLPKTEREKKVLGKAGKVINDTAVRAANAAKDAGKAKVAEVGLGSDAMRDQFRDLVSKASEAVKAAGQAAAKEAQKRD